MLRRTHARAVRKDAFFTREASATGSTAEQVNSLRAATDVTAYSAVVSLSLGLSSRRSSAAAPHPSSSRSKTGLSHFSGHCEPAQSPQESATFSSPSLIKMHCPETKRRTIRRATPACVVFMSAVIATERRLEILLSCAMGRQAIYSRKDTTEEKAFFFF